MREYEKDEDKDKTTKSDTKEEAKRLREFLEDYNDVRDDSKFFKLDIFICIDIKIYLFLYYIFWNINNVCNRVIGINIK